MSLEIPGHRCMYFFIKWKRLKNQDYFNDQML